MRRFLTFADQNKNMKFDDLMQQYTKSIYEFTHVFP